LWHGRPLKEAKNGVHLGGHHRLKRWHQEGVLPGRLQLCGWNRLSTSVSADLMRFGTGSCSQ
jgi:hypothetical protein